LCQSTDIPAKRAARLLPPTAYNCRPKTVWCITTQADKTTPNITQEGPGRPTNTARPNQLKLSGMFSKTVEPPVSQKVRPLSMVPVAKVVIKDKTPK
jgi:hypothetical protein